VNEWVFRLLEEDKVSSSAYFVTLTYDTRCVPITDNGFMTLDKSDVQKYFKRLRKLCKDVKLKYYLAGEYGSQNSRPHYHFICFNCPDIQFFSDAWCIDGVSIGGVHVGSVNTDSIAYTMKYIDKDSFGRKHSRDDRIPEFSLMSKNLGSSYLSDNVVSYHKKHIDQLFVTKLSGHKVAMPRYYRNKIFTDAEKAQQVSIVQSSLFNLAEKQRIDYNSKGYTLDYNAFKDSQRVERYRKFYHKSKQNRTL